MPLFVLAICSRACRAVLLKKLDCHTLETRHSSPTTRLTQQKAQSSQYQFPQLVFKMIRGIHCEVLLLNFTVKIWTLIMSWGKTASLACFFPLGVKQSQGHIKQVSSKRSKKVQCPVCKLEPDEKR